MAEQVFQDKHPWARARRTLWLCAEASACHFGESRAHSDKGRNSGFPVVSPDSSTQHACRQLCHLRVRFPTSRPSQLWASAVRWNSDVRNLQNPYCRCALSAASSFGQLEEVTIDATLVAQVTAHSSSRVGWPVAMCQDHRLYLSRKASKFEPPRETTTILANAWRRAAQAGQRMQLSKREFSGLQHSTGLSAALPLQNELIWQFPFGAM